MTDISLCISQEEADFFLHNGYLKLPGLIGPAELSRLQQAMDRLVETAAPGGHPDFFYAPGHKTGRPVLKRIEYVIDKADACKALLGHPFILRSVERLIGRDFIPTWDSMVLKLPGEGIAVPWHRDAAAGCVGDTPIFNVDFYLDTADLDTCVWAYPGSNHWPQERVDAIINRPGFQTDGAEPITMEPGDVLFHNILLLHGSPPNTSDKLRRVIYYEFRSAHTEKAIGPHRPEYIPLKQQVLLACLRRRKQADYASAEEPFVYQPSPEFAPGPDAESEPSTYRFAHEDYWRGG